MSQRTVLFTTAAVFTVLLGPAGPASATLIHSNSSNTIQGSLCLGFDCSANEPMGFSTLKLEENNLRINAADSSGGAFPTRDWQIEFNSSINGGPSYFMIRDCGNSGAAGDVSSTCGGTAMLTIEAGADNDSIYVDSAGNQGGNVGFGTTSPAVDIDVLSGNTPTLRLQQDGSSGFGPQTWDVAGNEANFFIRDVTGGSTLPIRIEPGTASNTLYLDNQERVGIGTSSPAVDLHIRHPDGDNFSTLRLTNPQGANEDWDLRTTTAGGFAITKAGTGAIEMALDGSGNMTLLGGLVTGTVGSCNIGTPCDAVFDPAVYTVPSIEVHAAFMWENKHLPAVGPTHPGQNVNVTEKMLRMLNELEHAHIYIEQLNAELKTQNKEIDALRALIVQD